MEDKSLFEKADVINFTVLVFVLLIACIVAVELYLVYLSDSPIKLIQHLLSWFLALASGIFMSYGLTRRNNDD